MYKKLLHGRVGEMVEKVFDGQRHRCPEVNISGDETERGAVALKELMIYAWAHEESSGIIRPRGLR